MKIQKKNGGGWVWGSVGEGSGEGVRGVGLVEGVRVDVNEELKFLGKFTKKNFGGGGGGGQGEFERRIEVFVKIQEKIGVLGGGGGFGL